MSETVIEVHNNECDSAGKTEESAQYGIPDRRAPQGKAAVFNLVKVDRADTPSGRIPGSPGGSVFQLLGCQDTGADVDFGTIFDFGSNFILYSIEDLNGAAPFCIFLEIGAKEQLICEEAFIDRGARSVAQLGCKVLVASLETVEAHVKTAKLNDAIDTGKFNLSVVWNTGRCGSTLMHKALLALHVGSFSEPQWLDQLCFSYSHNTDESILARALKACWVTDIHLLRALPRFQDCCAFSLNPKSCGWLLKVGEPFTKAFPTARHCFMYRDCDKVVESFGSLFASHGEQGPTKQDCAWQEQGVQGFSWLMPPGLVTACLNGEIPIAKLSRFTPARTTLTWLNCITAFLSMRKDHAEFTIAPIIRMDEFTSKDVALRNKVVGQALRCLGVLDNDDDLRLEQALAAFATNSQWNSAMGTAKRQLYLSQEERAIVHDVVMKASNLIPELLVQQSEPRHMLEGR